MAHLKTASITANRLLREQGLADKGWSFGWTTNKTRNGVCEHRNKMIKLSSVLSRVRTDEQVEQTLLHEIAHALVGPGHGHDRVWLAKARSLGYTGAARTDEGDTMQAMVKISRYVGTCDKCPTQYPRHRATVKTRLGEPAYRCPCGGSVTIRENTKVSA